MPRLRRASSWTGLAAFLVSGLAAAYADEEASQPKNIEELDLEQLLGKVTAASRQEESVLTAPASVTVLDENDIRQSGATTIPDLLRKVVGVQVLELSPGDYLVSLRGSGGLTGNNVVVLIDGVAVNSRIDGNVDWGTIPIDLSQVSRIEVVRGPVSTIYGPNAYTGVINIVSRPPAEAGANASRLVYLAGGVDSHAAGMGAGAFSISGTYGKLSGRLQANGRYDQLNSAAGGSPAWGMGGGTAYVQYDASPKVRLSLQLGGSFTQRNALDHLVLESLPQKNALYFGAFRLLFQDLPGHIESLEFWERTRVFQTFPSSDFTGFSYSGATAGDTSVGFDLRFALPHDFRLALGANGGIDYVDAPFIHPTENARLRPRYGFYGDLGVSIKGKWSLSAAVRGDASAQANGLHLAGRGSIIYHDVKWALRLSAGGAYRDPTYVEVGSRFIDPATGLILLEGTPGLRPPQIVSVELAAIVAPIINKLTIRPTVYLAQLSNLIFEDFEPLVRRTFDNENNARWLLGGELEASLQVLKQLYLEANISGLLWLNTVQSEAPPTVGDPGQNSTITAWLGARSSLLDGRLSLALGAGYGTPRAYALRDGIPPALLSLSTSHFARLEASSEFRPSRNWPFWLSLRLLSYLPNDTVETPLPGTSRLGTSVIFAVAYR